MLRYLGCVLAALFSLALGVQFPPLPRTVLLEIQPELLPLPTIELFEAVESTNPNFSQVFMNSNLDGVDGGVTAVLKNVGDPIKAGEEFIALSYAPGRTAELAASLAQAKHLSKVAMHERKRRLDIYTRALTLKEINREYVSPTEMEGSLQDLETAEQNFRAARQAVLVAEGRSTPYTRPAMIDGKVVWISERLRKGFVISDKATPVVLDKDKPKPDRDELLKIADVRHLSVRIPMTREKTKKVRRVQLSLNGQSLSVQSFFGRLGDDGNWRLIVEFENQDQAVRYLDEVEVQIEYK